MTRLALRAASPLSVALVGAGVIAAIALNLRLVSASREFTGFGSDALPPLFVAAFLAAAGLLRRRSVAGAWLATVTAAGLAEIEVIGAVRRMEPSIRLEAWPWVVAVAEFALIGAVAIAGAYAIKHDGAARGAWGAWATRAWRLLVMTGAGLLVTHALWTLGLTFAGDPMATAGGVGAGGISSELSPLRINGRFATAFIALAILGGIWRDLAGPWRRARARAGGLTDLPRALGEELLPTASGFRRRGREEERARLAADLHALVLPDLRRAARAAEASGDSGQPLAKDLRHAVEGVERLMHERQSVVLEEFGLVAALEWLAERTQENGALDVVVELDGAVDDPGALPKPVSRAAFRVAILAVDNVLRHAGASRLELRLDVHGATLELSVVDDGRSVGTGARAASGGHRAGRGMADMRAAATEVGATAEIRSSSVGTTVTFRWAGANAAAGHHATPGANSADRPSAPDR